jgi:hypothetical protein
MLPKTSMVMNKSKLASKLFNDHTFPEFESHELMLPPPTLKKSFIASSNGTAKIPSNEQIKKVIKQSLK